MENERKTDRSADMGMDEHRLSDILLASQIKATDIYETPPQIIWIDNSTIATLGNFSASTGKAKSKKTFNVSALVAASLAGKQVLNYRAHLPEGKQRILYVDTEQSRFHCRSVLERIMRLAGLPTTTDPENLDFFCLREYSPSVRVEVIDYALRQNKGYGLVIIDGIRDLMLDINSTGESVEVINRMMEWSSRYDLHIHCVLHLNKGDNNVRGHIGTEMSNKAETVLLVEKDKSNGDISNVSAMHIRAMDFEPFAFRINDNALPELIEGYRPEAKKPGRPEEEKFDPYRHITEQQHRIALEAAFGLKEEYGYKDLETALIKAYMSVGVKLNHQKAVSLITMLRNKRMIVQENGRKYTFKPDFHY